MKSSNGPPVVDPTAPLAQYWDKKVSELAAVQPTAITAEDAERHYIFSLLVAALVFRFWNGNKNGQTGDYPWRQGQKLPSGIYDGGQYFGHNIACIGVDGFGEVIDFDFNHNEIFSSSVEHAESRLVRRVFSLAQVYDDWHMRRSPPSSDDYMNILSNVTVYTSLESCAQCSGIMALGKVKAVAYLQQDPGMYCIGNILRNLTTPSLRAPLPISADGYGFPYYDDLNRGFRSFYAGVLQRPFYINSTGQNQDKSQSITSFLCTDEAKAIFDRASRDFQAYKVKFSSYQPLDNGKPNPRMLTNEQVLKHVRDFFNYASACGHRGTAHKL